ncbi:hypothetical protein MPSEU_000268500 [Mayamaea pseudoterrestris]|nr:hypothetical protein MPSEU_000268500 [Mayamaea pseudoterrestris]
MDMNQSTATTQQHHIAPPHGGNDPEEALLPELGLSPTRYVPVEIAAAQQHQHQHHQYQHHNGYESVPTEAVQQLQDQNHSHVLNDANNVPPLEQQQETMHYLHHQPQDPLNALTTLAVAAAPPRPQQEQEQQAFSLLDIMSGPHPTALPPPNGYLFAPPDGGSLQQQQQQQPPKMFQQLAPLINLDDPLSLAKALEAKDKEIKALKRALHKAQRKPQHVRESTASMIGQAVLSITNKAEPEADQVDPNTIKNLQERWRARFSQLVRYKLKHGHANVPKSYHDAPLHAWVRKQRINKQLRDRTNGVKGLSDDQVNALNSIGFAWVIGHQPRDDLWQSNYERLVQMYAAHGYIPTHCNDKSLTKWMQNQRARRKLLDTLGEGKARGMSYERVQKLDAIGFTWDARK